MVKGGVILNFLPSTWQKKVCTPNMARGELILNFSPSTWQKSSDGIEETLTNERDNEEESDKIDDFKRQKDHKRI